jgi:hypothetical protein
MKEIDRTHKYSRSVILNALDFEMSEAYWINAEGKIRPVKTIHIEDVIKKPVSFGLTGKYVKNMYKKYREKMGIEGKARDEIVKVLVLKGWTRIRYFNCSDYFSIDVGRLDEKVKEYLYEWAFKTIQSCPMRRNSRVVIVENSTMENKIYMLGDLAGDAFLSKKEQNDLVNYYLIPLKREDDFLDDGPFYDLLRSMGINL